MLEALSQAASANGGTDLLGLAKDRLHWLEARESVLAGNVANANTPGYVPKDMTPFQGVLQEQMGMTLAQTEPGHMAGQGGSARTDRTGGSASPDKNEVSLEAELEKVADTSDQQRFATNVYSLYMSMYSTALGTGGSTS
ncbi:putative flagellar basal-body rod protein FlgB [Gluconacetobacter diazotrophicus PA1 5]|uniref:flagellar basal body rod protein FlgB n=1 Tax=Gluconacetobacter diazotrophicus TaxID=33996 RepID=UPI000173C81C|nr:flagellar biosynthesis protein FlgB [Gluconacetobacter diazotrophicus]ACI53162.1 putative flagellar basal-body rod protein FlgB [Gluconacetobacter diazotrophicus PA1 5]TWB10465.1 flagellar basal-body rod protein FlgB [Gluconacetobacter diazotrophicus]